MPGGPGAAALAATPQSSTAPHYDPSSCPWALAPTGATRPAPGDSPSLPWVTLCSIYTHRSVPAARTHTPHRDPAQRRLPHLGLPPCESGHRPRNPLPRWGHPRDSPGSGAGCVGLFGSMGAGFPCPRAPGLTPKGQLPLACGEGGRGGGATRRQRQQRKPAWRLQTGSDRTRVLRRQRRGQGRQARAAQRGTDQPRGRPLPAPSLPPPRPAHAPATADRSHALQGGGWRPLPACPSRFSSRRTPGSQGPWHREASALGSGATPRLQGGHSPTEVALTRSHPHSAVSPKHLPHARPCAGPQSPELCGVFQAAGAAPVPRHSWRERAKDSPAQVGGRAESRGPTEMLWHEACGDRKGGWRGRRGTYCHWGLSSRGLLPTRSRGPVQALPPPESPSGCSALALLEPILVCLEKGGLDICWWGGHDSAALGGRLGPEGHPRHAQRVCHKLLAGVG